MQVQQRVASFLIATTSKAAGKHRKRGTEREKGWASKVSSFLVAPLCVRILWLSFTPAHTHTHTHSTSSVRLDVSKSQHKRLSRQSVRESLITARLYLLHPSPHASLSRNFSVFQFQFSFSFSKWAWHLFGLPQHLHSLYSLKRMSLAKLKQQTLRRDTARVSKREGEAVQKGQDSNRRLPGNAMEFGMFSILICVCL